MKRFEANGTHGSATEVPPASDDGANAEHADVPFVLAPSAMLLLTETQAATYLNISARKVWELAACGVLPFIKIGAVKRYRRIDLEEWVGSGCPMTRAK